ncbi:hypothetical protein [Streptomyces sp. NPDC051219]|uniref:hypothetical protein n=1 Tax=Streptomyces sp. NPDC051219 TaxID=3155283 RepID=UPI0034351260
MRLFSEGPATGEGVVEGVGHDEADRQLKRAQVVLGEAGPGRDAIAGQAAASSSAVKAARSGYLYLPGDELHGLARKLDPAPGEPAVLRMEFSSITQPNRVAPRLPATSAS